MPTIGMAAIRMPEIRSRLPGCLQFNGQRIRRASAEIYHYNSDGTLDWGYFQINTVHLERPGLNLRDLLDCKANINFAYQLYQEKHGFNPWSTYNSGIMGSLSLWGVEPARAPFGGHFRKD